MSKAKLIEIRDNSEAIMEIAENTKILIHEENNIAISQSVGIPTISYWFMRAVIDYLNENKTNTGDVEINLLGILSLGISHRDEEDAEKDGNFTPYLEAGPEFKALVSKTEIAAE